VGLKYYACLDDKALEELPDVDLKSFRNVTLDFQSVTFLFLPEELERLQATFVDAIKLISDKNLYIAGGRDYHRLIDSMAKAEAAYDVKNAALQVMLILEVFYQTSGGTGRELGDRGRSQETQEDGPGLVRVWIGWTLRRCRPANEKGAWTDGGQEDHRQGHHRPGLGNPGHELSEPWRINRSALSRRLGHYQNSVR
jgi:hypothetical protein